MDIRLKKPQLKNDEYSELRKWMLDVYTILKETPRLRGDGNRLLITQSEIGSTIKLLEDSYKKQFSFYVESMQGGAYSAYQNFAIRGGLVTKPGINFSLSGIIQKIDKKYLYLTIKNIDADEAAEIPAGEGNTQQDIDDQTEENFYAKFEITDSYKDPAVTDKEINIIIGTQLNGVFSQKYTGDYNISGLGSGVKLYRVTEADYTGDPETEDIYKVTEAENMVYDSNVTPDPQKDKFARVDGAGYPFGLTVGRVYPSFKQIGGIPELHAPESFTVRYNSGWKLYDSHEGNELMSIAGADIEVLNNPASDITKFDGVYFPAFWDEIRQKLTVKIPTM